MSSTDPFALLGLKRASASERDVKAAYARLLKETRPEEDRAAFMALRDAFTSARSIARFNDQEKEKRPEPAIEPSSKTSKHAEEPKPVSWILNKALEWSHTNDATGRLVNETLEWMVAAGPDADAFAQKTAETLMTTPDINEHIFRREVRHFLFNQVDKKGKSHSLNIWEEFEAERPDWLNHELMIVLHRDIQIFKSRPTETWQARGYNVLLKLFEPALQIANASEETIERLDPAGLYTEEQNQDRKDEHGSHFDRDRMAWLDKSPVGLAMTDVQAAIDKSLWDLPEVCREIFRRDDLQPLEEFQDLDSRMRNLICEATGYNAQERKLTYPTWFSSKLALLLEKTFGWNRHFGRNHWERQQFDWLHKVLARDVKSERNTTQFGEKRIIRRFEISDDALIPPRPSPRNESGPLARLSIRLYNKPHELLLGYLGFRVVQILIRLVT